MRSDVSVKAVYDNDLERLLERLGLLGPLRDGLLKCAVCEREVTYDNLGTIFASEGEIKLSCDSDRCVHIVTTRAGASERGRG